MFSSVTSFFLIIGWGFWVMYTTDGNKIPHFDPGLNLDTLTLKEDTPVGELVFQLKGYDEDGDELVFGIEGKGKDKFLVNLVNNTEADIFLQQPLDREISSEISVTFTLTDGKLSLPVRKSCTIFIIDVNDEVPKFINLKPRIIVPENTTINSIVSTIEAVDRDQGVYGSIIFFLKDSDTFAIKTVNPSNGTAVLYLIKELDYEKKQLYNLEVIAMDAPSLPPGQRNTAVVILVIEVGDVQDSPPRFIYAPTFIKITENVPKGYSVFLFKAEDEDRGIPNDIVYSITDVSPSDGSSIFQLDSTSGLLTVQESILKKTNPDVKEMYMLTVMAEEVQSPHDSVTTQISIFIEDVNDHPPMFANSSYIGQIIENSPQGMTITFLESYIALVKDFDQGNNGRFNLQLEEDHGIFEVLPISVQGEANFIIQVKNPSGLDYELSKSIEFKLLAIESLTEEKWNSQVTVQVNILDANDHSPVFEKSEYVAFLLENATVGDVVLQVQANDVDDGNYGDIRYVNLQGTLAEKFVLNPVSGLLTVNSSTGFDREDIEQYFLILEAEDNQGNHGNRAMTHVTVKLTDINDNSPHFAQSIYRVTLKDDLASFQNPVKVKASDADEQGNPNSEIRYSILDGDDNNTFTINAVTGELMWVQPLNKDVTLKQIYNLTIMATDLGHPSLNNKAIVLLYPKDYWSTNFEQPNQNKVVNATFPWSLWFTVALVIILSICLIIVSSFLHQQMKKNKIGPDPTGYDIKEKNIGRTPDEKYISVCSTQNGFELRELEEER